MRSARTLAIAAVASLGLVACTAREQPAGESGRAAEEGFVTATDGARLYFRKVGNSPRVVILPGRLFTFADFEWIGDDFTLIAYDMRNRGRSELIADDARISFELDVADLEAVRRHFGVERASLVGYSYLGKIVVLYALENPGRVERIVQLGAVGPDFGTEYRPEFVFKDDPVDPAALAALRAKRSEQNFHVTHPRDYCREEWSVVHLPTLVGDPGRIDRVRIEVCDMPNEWPILQARHLRLHFAESGMAHRTPVEAVRELRVPVLTVHGTRDRNAPYGAGREWAYLLPDARLFTVEGGGHHAFGEFPQVVMPAVSRFLDGEWPDAATRVTDDPRRH
jgi:pimeloyl-ACP methyl ester carboxylesterase